ncbi:MAG: DUF4384 domain-containing protein [Desulfobulbaceae bacterium]|nr:DUF4384 domain-containing protein [Desulfobulbaceae bacterium]
MNVKYNFFKKQRLTYLVVIFFLCITFNLSLPGNDEAYQVFASQGSVKLTKASSFNSLGELTVGLVSKMTDDLRNKTIYFDRTNIVDIRTTNASPFSVHLASEMDVALTSVFTMVKEPVQADFILRVSYQRNVEVVRVFCNYFDVKKFVTKTVYQSIGINNLPDDSFEENLRSKAYKLAAGIINEDVKKRLYVQPIREAVDGYVSEFSVTFGLLLKSEIARLYTHLELVDETIVSVNLDPEAVVKRTAEDVELELINAVLADADSIMCGEYFVSGDKIILTLFIKDLEGRILNSVSEEMEKILVPNLLVDNTSHALADYADKSSESDGGEKMVKISSTKGGDNPVYHSKEKMTFYLQVDQPLYIYLYDIDSMGHVSRLFPLVEEQEEKPFQVGKLYIYPKKEDGIELEVNPPFGKDIVKVFASSKPLPLPELDESTPLLGYTKGMRAIKVKRKEIQGELATTRTIHPKDLVDYYRGVAAKKKVDLFENSIFIETKE